MVIEFAYAKARSQAWLGDRLSETGWQTLETSRDLAQYLHAARGMPIWRYVQHFTASSSPHAIERSLRRDWRSVVAGRAQWVPGSWRPAVRWTRLLPDLPAIAHVASGEAALEWMADDPSLASLTLALNTAQPAASVSGKSQLPSVAALDDVLVWWRERWQTLWPAGAYEVAGLRELTTLIGAFLESNETAFGTRGKSDNPVTRLDYAVTRLLRLKHAQPMTIFCHLLLTALDLWRLRAGLVRRALFNDVAPGQAA